MCLQLPAEVAALYAQTHMAIDLTEIKLLYNNHDEINEIILRKPLLHILREKILLVRTVWFKV